METGSYISYKNSLRFKKDKKGKLLSLLFLSIIFIALLYYFFNNSVVIKSMNTKAVNKNLENSIQASLKGTKGIYGIVIKNLKTGENYSVNNQKSFEAGSLYKLWVLATAFSQIQEGSLKMDEILTSDIINLNEEFKIPQDLAELREGTITLSVNEALNQMITISHNYAALLLTKKVRLSQVSLFLTKSGFTDSSVGVDNTPPKSTPSDIALFFEKLYKGELANPENSEKMINLLKSQKLNDKLPKYLPEDVEIAHKTGEIDFVSHDAGIVFSPKGDYIIVVMSDSSSPAGADERVAQVSKAVYDYFNPR